MLTAIELNRATPQSDTHHLTSITKIPSTPARKTSEFFDKINNLDPIKFSPSAGTELIESKTMHNG